MRVQGSTNMIGADEQRKFLNFKTSQMAKNDQKSGY